MYLSTFRRWWSVITGVYDILGLWRLQLLGRCSLWVMLFMTILGNELEKIVEWFSFLKFWVFFNDEAPIIALVACWLLYSAIHILGFNINMLLDCVSKDSSWLSVPRSISDLSSRDQLLVHVYSEVRPLSIVSNLSNCYDLKEIIQQWYH